MIYNNTHARILRGEVVAPLYQQLAADWWLRREITRVQMEIWRIDFRGEDGPKDYRYWACCALRELRKMMPKSLNETLWELGYTTETADHGKKRILRVGERVFCGTARETWQWLRDRGEIERRWYA